MYKYSYENLKKAAETVQGKEFLDNIEKLYKEEFEGVPIEVFNYSFIKMYYKNGDRAKHENLWFARRKRLKYLQVLAIKNDEYLEPLEQIIFTICNEQIWVLPAHNLLAGENVYDETVIDLFSAETGFYLAETLYVLQDKLSSDIKHKIRLALNEKIVENFECRTFLWDAITSNWAAVCAGSVGLTYMYAFPERFDAIKPRIFNTLKCYLNGINEDGYCEEGVSYWEYGFGYFSIFFDIYKQIYGDCEILHDQKVKNLLNYIFNAQMDENIFLPFADGGCKISCFDTSNLYAMESLYEVSFDRFLFDDKFATYDSSKPLYFRILYGLANHIAENPIDKTNISSVYYSKAQVFIYKNKRYSFAVKGGNNAENHNHNDVGTFQIVSGGKRLIADLGAGKYTRQYFHDMTARYGEKIFVCGSMSHSVPIVDGKYQSDGVAFFGKVLSYGNNFIEYDISKAYDLTEMSLTVRYETGEKALKVIYRYSGIRSGIVFRFVSDCVAVLDGSTVKIGNMKIVSDIKPTIHEREYPAHGNSVGRAVIIDYAADGKNTSQEFFFKF